MHLKIKVLLEKEILCEFYFFPFFAKVFVNHFSPRATSSFVSSLLTLDYKRKGGKENGAYHSRLLSKQQEYEIENLTPSSAHYLDVSRGTNWST